MKIYRMSLKQSLRNYQKKAARQVLNNNYHALFLDMGLGKTIIMLACIKALKAKKKIKGALVVAPLSVVKNVWRQEALKWDYTHDLRFIILRGKNKELALLTGRRDIYLINYESLIWLAKELRLLRAKGISWPFDMIVFDESTKMKSPGAKRFRRWRKLVEYFDRRYIMTGTPSDDSLKDVWAQVYLLDQGRALGRTYQEFVDRYFYKPRPKQAPYLLVPKKKAEKVIAGKIKPFSTMMEADDYLELPEYEYQPVRVELSAEMMERYRQLEKELFLKLNEDEKMFVLSMNALSMKLRQLTSGFVYHQDKQMWFHNEKVQTLQELEENVLVMVQFQATAEMLHKELQNSAVITGQTPQENRSAIINRWNAGKLKYLIAHPRVIGMGLNLEGGGRVIAWYDIPWSLSEYRQANARLRRGEQKLPVLVMLLVCRSTIDERIIAALNRKKMSSDVVVTYLKEKFGRKK